MRAGLMPVACWTLRRVFWASSRVPSAVVDGGKFR